MNPYAGIILDIIVLCVLAATIIHARRLSRQFAEMQQGRKTFEKLIESINQAAARADGATKSLREAAQQGGDRLQDKINTARGLADELEIIVQAGDSLAGRLEGLARRTSAPREPVLPRNENRTEKVPDGRAEPRTRAEKELLDALRAKRQSS
ncbi:MAG: hypothetical protein EPN97_12750 [Alphaproteobacteria bacterium]|nr:MAG: hypothetical protein EPN97_12750 [Alphaproteobacteria bacterium]